jgi:hypothetical protein
LVEGHLDYLVLIGAGLRRCGQGRRDCQEHRRKEETPYREKIRCHADDPLSGKGLGSTKIYGERRGKREEGERWE